MEQLSEYVRSEHAGDLSAAISSDGIVDQLDGLVALRSLATRRIRELRKPAWKARMEAIRDHSLYLCAHSDSLWFYREMSDDISVFRHDDVLPLNEGEEGGEEDSLRHLRLSDCPCEDSPFMRYLVSSMIRNSAQRGVEDITKTSIVYVAVFKREAGDDHILVKVGGTATTNVRERFQRHRTLSGRFFRGQDQKAESGVAAVCGNIERPFTTTGKSPMTVLLWDHFHVPLKNHPELHVPVLSCCPEGRGGAENSLESRWRKHLEPHGVLTDGVLHILQDTHRQILG